MSTCDASGWGRSPCSCSSTGGVAYAANTVFSSDIVNGEVKSVDIGTGQVQTADVKNESLTGHDIQDNTIGGADVNEALLDSGVVKGRGEVAFESDRARAGRSR